MSADRFSRTWSVGRYTVTVSCPKSSPPGGVLFVSIAWEPHFPDDLTHEERVLYATGYCDAVDAMKRETDVLLHVPNPDQEWPDRCH